MKKGIYLVAIWVFCMMGCAGNTEDEGIKNEKEVEKEAESNIVITNEDAVSVFDNLVVGENVKMGKYEQDNIMENGKEAIGWVVVDVQPGMALLVSEKGLDCKQYNETEDAVTWESCTLRNWLNKTFLYEAFDENERNGILNTLIVNNDNPEFGTDGGNDTVDKVFLLSIEDIKNYCFELQIFEGRTESGEKLETISFNKDCVVVPTAYAISQGALADQFFIWDIETGYWWLRTPGYDGMEHGGFYYATYVSNRAEVNNFGAIVNNDWKMVRPAIWVKINNN